LMFSASALMLSASIPALRFRSKSILIRDGTICIVIAPMVAGVAFGVFGAFGAFGIGPDSFVFS
jgi:hypothetical protein